jgi:hypothetical protein
MPTDPQQARQLLYDLLADLPPRDRPVAVQPVGQVETVDYVLERLVLDLNGLESVPAYFVRPHGPPSARPVILYNHYHGSGKHELVEEEGLLQDPSYAVEFARLGLSALSIDAWRLLRWGTGHFETAQMRHEILAWLQARL